MPPRTINPFSFDLEAKTLTIHDKTFKAIAVESSAVDFAKQPDKRSELLFRFEDLPVEALEALDFDGKVARWQRVEGEGKFWVIGIPSQYDFSDGKVITDVKIQEYAKEAE